MASDLLASLKPWSIEDIVIVDHVYRIPALPAIDWLVLLLDENVSLFAVTALLEPSRMKGRIQPLKKLKLPHSPQRLSLPHGRTMFVHNP